MPSEDGFYGRPPSRRSRTPTPEAYTAPGRSALLHWKLVATVVVIGLLLGCGYGVARSPKYSAEEQLYVGKTLSLNNTAAIPGLAAAASQIAGDYSRLILSQEVLGAAATTLGHPGFLGGTLTASQIPQAPQLRVDAKASSQDAAVRLADAGAKALIAAVAKINASSSAQLSALLTQYQKLQTQIEQDQQTVASLQASIGSLQAQHSPSSSITPLQDQLTTLQTQISSATLQANAVQNQYQTSYSPLQAEEQVLQSVGPAAPTGSDRTKVLELVALLGAVVGLLLGVTIASLKDLRAARRAVAPRRD